MTSLPPRSASLAPFFTPNGVAIIGASRDPGKLSYGVIRNLADPDRGYPGPIYPVNPKADAILGLKCYPDIAAVPDPVELAVLIIPAGMVIGAIEACGRRGIKAAVVISGGFREVGSEGAAREAEMLAVAQRYGMRIVGPNGIGVMDMHTPLNTTFVKGMPPVGSIAFLSQSGALCGGIIDWTIGRGIGFSRFLSVGNEADVNETDVIPYLAADDATRVITLYLEDVKGGPAFVDVLRGLHHPRVNYPAEAAPQPAPVSPPPEEPPAAHTPARPGSAGALVAAMVGLCQGRPSLAAPLRSATARLEGDTLLVEVPADFVAFATMHADEYRDLAKKAAGKTLHVKLVAGGAIPPDAPDGPVSAAPEEDRRQRLREEAEKEPAVQEALDLFDGRVVDVREAKTSREDA